MDQGRRESWIDKTIRDAQEKGYFDNLQGAGRPINWEDEALVDADWALAFRIMREHGFAPEWIELHKAIRDELMQAREAVLRAWRRLQENPVNVRGTHIQARDGEWRRARGAFDEAITELNAKIADFNLKVPVPRLQMLELDAAQELEKLGIIQ